jgi:DNA-binding transcriptional LysR family regulator
MTLWQLKTFATVAREGSFTKAGKVLQISQPSVSSLVISLQKELGVKLFEKLGMRPHLTEAGRRLLKLAETTLATVDRIPKEMEEVSTVKKGRLTIGGAGFAGATLLPVAVQAFKKAFPSIEVSLMVQASVVLEEKLLNGELDIAFLSLAPKSRLLVSKAYYEEEIVAVASPSHPLVKRSSIPLELLAQEPIVADGKGGHSRKKVENLFARKGLPFEPALEIDVLYGSRDAIKTAVANGLGIAFLSKHHIDWDVKAGRLKILKLSDFNLKRSMYLAFHKARQNPSVQIFVRFLQNYQTQQTL